MQKTFFSLSSIKKLIVMRMQLNMNGSKKISDMIQIEPFLINKQKSCGQAALLFI
ncbi:hypothetical protein [Bacillus subtilis]|uniref:hypothetical protein n=1 Tax=Bacillus subtilis TaxID=1423 RepID=UPI00139D85DB|nr:hypothetical protein [Bacillus subtilis]NDK01172.1 hypothetical protein [Bacillus subtilis subsp. subtilis]